MKKMQNLPAKGKFFCSKITDLILSSPYLYIRFLSIRKNYFLKKAPIRYYESEYARENTISHNSLALIDITCDVSMSRIERLLWPILSLENIVKSSKVLVIGPRTEHDIFMVRKHGFINVYGLDLISYSPHIFCGDMHEIPFPDSTFDVVIVGWTLAYSNNQRLALSEIFRVVRAGGCVALGWEHLLGAVVRPQESSIKAEDDIGKINDIQDLDRLLSDNENINWIFRSNAPLRNYDASTNEAVHGLAKSQCLAIIGKGNPSLSENCR